MFATVTDIVGRVRRRLHASLFSTYLTRATSWGYGLQLSLKLLLHTTQYLLLWNLSVLPNSVHGSWTPIASIHHTGAGPPREQGARGATCRHSFTCSSDCKSMISPSPLAVLPSDQSSFKPVSYGCLAAVVPRAGLVLGKVSRLLTCSLHMDRRPASLSGCAP